jgi:uncharacterized repeat protein (TIGR02543 family)
MLALWWLAFLRPASATTQLIVNGGFTATTPAPWVLQGTGVQVSSSGYLSMGNASGQIQEVYQTITFPSNLIGATLSLEFDIVSSNPYGDDTLVIYITDTNRGTILEALGTNSSAYPTSGYVYGTTNFITYAGSDMLSSYAGETVDLLFYVTTDTTYGGLTSFNITDVSLVAGTTADIPANDDFANATLISPTGITNDVTTTYASKETGEPNHAGNAGGHSLWWVWTAPATGTVTITTAGSAFDTLLAVYTGSSLTNLTVVTNCDGALRNSGLASLRFNVSPATQFHIALDGYDGESGSAVFTFRFSTDTTRPTVAFKSPAAGADVANSTLLVQGTASDNVAVAAVYCRLENAAGTNAWLPATGTNSWSVTFTNLIPGPNTVRAEAIDTSSNVSVTVARLFNFLVPIPLTLTKIGQGTVSRATNGQLLDLAYPYKLTATAAPGFAFRGWTGDISTNTATVSFIMRSNLSLTANFADVEKPTLSITAPRVGERWSNSLFNVTGKASDNVGVAAVWYQLNTQAWTSNVITTNASTNWSASVSLSPGPNTIKAYAMDAAGNISPTNSVNFIYVVSAILTVGTNGPGTIHPNYNNVLLAVSNAYSMTATAGKGYVFSNWTANAGAVVTNGPVLKFIMQSNLIFTANFVPNPFLPVGGTYQGLFYDTNGVTPPGSGFFSALVNTNGTFTAKFQQGLKSFPVAGQFSLTGGWFTNALKAWSNTAIGLQLDMTGGNVLQGGLTNAAWTAQLRANRALFSKTNPAPQAGKYTLVIPGANSPAPPGGDGFGALTVDTSGNVTFNGTLGDGTSVTPSAIESAHGQWPFYVSLDSGNGMLLGWLAFTNEPDRDIDGLLHWFKPSQPTAKTYKAGFTNVFEAAGSAYSFTKGGRILNLTNGFVLLQDGGLTPSISNQFTLSSNNIVTGSNQLRMTMTTTTGLFQGTTTNAAGKSISFSGAVFQKLTNGFGQFLNTNQTGSVSLAPR